MAAKNSTIESMNLRQLLNTMDSFGINTDDIESIGDARKLFNETIAAQGTGDWTIGKAFTVFKDAKDSDESRRKELMAFYKKAKAVIKNCEKELQQYLCTKFSVRNIIKEIERRMNNLKVEEYVVLFAGETSSGKSSLINLILGEDILPSGHLPITATICELRYGDTRKLEVFYKDIEKPEVVLLRDPSEGMTYPEQLQTYMSPRNERENSPFIKCTLFWPHELLMNGIVFVDSPGVGETDELTKVVIDYLLNAFCFVYVIDSSHAGGVQKDRIIHLLEKLHHAKDQRLETLLCECAIFVCNKWDLIQDKDSEEVKIYTIERLEKSWANLNQTTQVIQMSTENAAIAQKLGVKSEQFISFMNAIKTMLLKTIAGRLETEWRWLNDVLSRMIFQTKLVINRARSDKLVNNLPEAVFFLMMIEFERKEKVKSLEEDIKKVEKETVDKIFEHVTSNKIERELKSWKEHECPKPEKTWKETEKKVDEALGSRLTKKIREWEDSAHVIENARKVLFNDLKRKRDYFNARIKQVEDYVVKDPVTARGTINPEIPPGRLKKFIRLPVLCFFAVKNAIKSWENLHEYKKNKPKYMEKKAIEFFGELIKRERFEEYVSQQFEEVRNILHEIKEEIPALIEADKFFMKLLIDYSKSKFQDAEKYAPVYKECSQIKGDLSIFGIHGVFLSDIDYNNLKYTKQSSIGHGAFGDVFKGEMTTQEGESLDVAVKVCKEVLTTHNASMLLAEEQTLRKLDHKNVVKFYGRTLQPDPHGSKFVFVMELCGESLRKFFSNHPECIPAKAQPENKVAIIKSLLQRAKDIGKGLAYLHSLGIVHRDLKPENILFGRDDCMKIADVGVSKKITEVTGTMAGTPVYMAPEIFAGKICDARADIYSFGLILWEMWYGEVAFSDLGDVDLNSFGEKIQNGHRPNSITTISKYESLLENCWPTVPEKRLTADQCVAELDSILTAWS